MKMAITSINRKFWENWENSPSKTSHFCLKRRYSSHTWKKYERPGRIFPQYSALMPKKHRTFAKKKTSHLLAVNPPLFPPTKILFSQKLCVIFLNLIYFSKFHLRSVKKKQIKMTSVCEFA